MFNWNSRHYTCKSIVRVSTLFEFWNLSRIQVEILIFKLQNITKKGRQLCVYCIMWPINDTGLIKRHFSENFVQVHMILRHFFWISTFVLVSFNFFFKFCCFISFFILKGTICRSIISLNFLKPNSVHLHFNPFWTKFAKIFFLHFT